MNKFQFLKMYGRSVSLTNMITNGNYSSTSTWSSYSLASFTVSSNEATITANATSGYLYQTFSMVNGRKYYLCGYIKSTSSSIDISITDTISSETATSHSGSGSYEFLSLIHSSIATTSVARARSSRDNRSSGFNAINSKYCTLIDLTTAFGSGKEPTKAQMDNLMTQFYNNWFDGTKTAIYTW